MLSNIHNHPNCTLLRFFSCRCPQCVGEFSANLNKQDGDSSSTTTRIMQQHQQQQQQQRQAKKYETSSSIEEDDDYSRINNNQSNNASRNDFADPLGMGLFGASTSDFGAPAPQKSKTAAIASSSSSSHFPKGTPKFPTPHEIIRSLKFDPFDPARKNSFVVEWRCTPGGLVDTLIASAQSHLTANHPKVHVLESCRAGNFHITINEFALDNPSQLHELLVFAQGFTSKTMPLLAAQFAHKLLTTVDDNIFNIHLDGLNDFRREVFYVGLKGTGVDFLKLILAEFHKNLYLHFQKQPKNIHSSPTPTRELVPHLTIGRAQKGARAPANWYDTLKNDKKLNQLLDGAQSSPEGDLGEIVFCSKRHPHNEERQPPLIMKVFPM